MFGKMRSILYITVMLLNLNYLVADVRPGITLDQYLAEKGFLSLEGHCKSDKNNEPEFLANLIKKNPQVKLVAEIGFNGGHSSEIFLENRYNTFVYSFDIMAHPYVIHGKEYIDAKFPGRHILIPGNSSISVPEYFAENDSLKFDLIFIDGGHSYEIALTDIMNMQAFAHRDTILVIDDIWIDGVRKAWKESISKGLITEGKVFKSGHRQWAQCKYIDP